MIATDWRCLYDLVCVDFVYGEDSDTTVSYVRLCGFRPTVATAHVVLTLLSQKTVLLLESYFVAILYFTFSHHPALTTALYRERKPSLPVGAHIVYFYPVVCPDLRG